MSLSGPAKVVVTTLGGAALLGWGTAFYLWNQPQSEALTAVGTASEALAEVKDDVEDKQDLAVRAEQLQAEISKADTDLEARIETLKSREQQITEAEDQLANIKSEIETGEDRLDNMTVEIDQGKVAIDQHEITLAALQEDQTSIEKAIAKARVELDDVTSALDTERAPPEETEPDLEDHQTWEPLSLDPVMTAVPVQTPMGLRVSLVHFDRGSADVSPGGQRKANDVAAWIKTHGAASIQVMGFADTRGSKTANKELSERRARSVAALLEKAGISGTKLEIIPHGEDQLPETTKDQVSEPLNRCVGIFITPEPASGSG